MDTPVWFPVLTLLLGFGLNSVTESLRRRHELTRDREARLEARRDQLAEHRRTFQRETLLALQEAAMDLMRSTGAAHHQDEMEYRKTGEWQKKLLGEELNQASFLAMRQTAMLGVRVRDGSLRQLIQEFRQASAEEAVPVSREASNAALARMADLFLKIQERVGELLRTLDDEETSLAAPK